MSLLSSFFLVMAINLGAFLLINYLAFRSNDSDNWRVMIQSNVAKIVLFVFAVPALLIYVVFYIKGWLQRRW
jgi:hypothetical protein